MSEENKDIEYWKNNASEDYITTPISVLRYITELEKIQNKVNVTLGSFSKSFYCLDAGMKGEKHLCKKQCDTCRRVQD